MSADRGKDNRLDLRRYLALVNRRKWIVIVATLLTAATAFLLSSQQTARYQASARLLLKSSEAELLLSPPQGGGDQTEVLTEIAVIQSQTVRELANEALGPRRASVSVSSDRDTQIVVITATSEVPAEAARTANIYAQTYVDWRRTTQLEALFDARATIQAELERYQAELADLQAPVDALKLLLSSAPTEENAATIQAQIDAIVAEISPEANAINEQIARYDTQLSELQISENISSSGGVQILDPARVPTTPFEPKPGQSAMIGAMAGFALGIGLALLFDSLDDRLRTKEDLERVTGLAALGLIPDHSDRKSPSELVALTDPGSSAAESYRALRTSIQFLGIDRRLKVIQVTSACSEDGKSNLSANLAIVTAQMGFKVALLDADLRRSRLHTLFDIDNDIGLTSLLSGTARVSDAVHRVDSPSSLFVIPAGPMPPNPSDLLGLDRFGAIVEATTSVFDFVIIDTPPLLHVPDPLIVSGSVDGVLMVAQAARASRRDMARAMELLDQANANVLGLVINGLPRTKRDEYYSRYESTSTAEHLRSEDLDQADESIEERLA